MKLSLKSLLIFCALTVTLSSCDKLNLFSSKAKITGLWDAKTISSGGTTISLPEATTGLDFEANITKIDDDNVKIDLSVFIGEDRDTETYESAVTKSGKDYNLTLDANTKAVITGENMTISVTDGEDSFELALVKVK